MTATPGRPDNSGTPGAQYTAYSYLPPGSFPQFELTPEFGRVPPYEPDLTPAQQRRARALLTGSLVISLHDHLVRFPARMEQTPGYNRTGRQHTGYAGLAASGLTVVFDNMMDGTARAVWATPRMKSDDVLRAVAGTGGVIGMSAAPHTTLSAAHPRHSIESVMDHFRYCADLVGLDHLAFGPDTLYGDHVRLHKIFAHLLSLSASRGPSFDPVDYVDGLENPTENFANICAWLVRHDFTDDQIRAVLGGNIYRALGNVWIG